MALVRLFDANLGLRSPRRAVSPLLAKDAAGTPEVPAPVVHEGGRAMLPHNLIAGIGKETDTDTDIPTHSTTETETKTKTNRDGRGRGRERERERQQKIPRSFIAPPPFYGLQTLVGRRPAVRRKPHNKFFVCKWLNGDRFLGKHGKSNTEARKVRQNERKQEGTSW